MAEIKLLDCTLRDGGYVNDWNFGHDSIINIFERLVSAEVDIIEIGFLDERQPFCPDRTIAPGIKEMERIYQGLDKKNSMIVGMIDYGTCGIEHLIPCADSFLDGIRIIFKKEKMVPAIAFCKEVKALGYQVFAQAVSITSYSDDELKVLIDMVNELEPYAFSLVDTYGLLHKGQLLHYFKLANEYLKPQIGLGYHSHNNFQLAYANCIELIEDPIERPLVVDGSLYGMGKSAGNAPTELLATYLRDNCQKKYDISQLLEAIDTTILNIFRQIPWGYTFKFFLSASNDCHPNYVTFLKDKKKLSVKSINEILESIAPEKKLLYDKDYIEQLYIAYQKKDCDDTDSYNRLQEKLAGKKILLLGPGNRVEEEADKVRAYIEKEKPAVISINFLPELYAVDFVFVSNAKRYVQLSRQLSQEELKAEVIATSNVTKTAGQFDYTLRYSDLLDEEAMIVDNPMLMLLKAFDRIGVEKVALAGFDGYTRAIQQNYVNPNMEHTFSKEKAQEINEDVKQSLRRLKLQWPVEFVTVSLYEDYKLKN